MKNWPHPLDPDDRIHWTAWLGVGLAAAGTVAWAVVPIATAVAHWLR